MNPLPSATTERAKRFVREQGSGGSCVDRHPRGRVAVLIMTEHVVICKGDHSAAAVLRLLIHKVDSNTPLVFSRVSLANDLAQHYSIDTISKALDVLKSLGFIALHRKHGGAEMTAQLYPEVVSQAIRALPDDFGVDTLLFRDNSRHGCRKIPAPPKADQGAGKILQGCRKIPAGVQEKTCTSAGKILHPEACYKEVSISVLDSTHSSARVCESNYFEDQLQNPQTQTLSPQPPSPTAERPDADVGEDTLEPNLLPGIWNRHKGAPKLKAADKRYLIEKAESWSYTHGQVTEAMDAFFEDEYWRGQGFPLAGFLKQIAKYVSDVPVASTRSAAAVVPLVPSLRPASTLEPPALPATVVEWNGIVPEHMRIASLSRFAAKDLSDALAEPEFAQNTTQIFGTCAKLASGGKIDQPNFYWLFRTAKGKPVWWQVLNGLYNYALPKDDIGAAGKSVDDFVRELMAYDAARQAAKTAPVQK